ncbi:magnesium/cobalt transporter CorA [Maridesulfovibrio sp. FT414]|uniref:magnesium/cobalt transporter CorA n=1 Tax=Maridesulfovibrio sp. FT414 TaxID=2979469 RepID=UPI003D807CDE
MARFLRKNDLKAGLPPGALVFTGKQKVEKPILRYVAYNSEEMEDLSIGELEEIEDVEDIGMISWLNVDGVHDSELIREMGEYFSLSPMVLEDIQDTGQRPSITEFQDYVFVTLKIFCMDDEGGRLKTDQVCFILGPDYLISFQEQPGSVFEPVRNRLLRKKGRIRSKGADYLLYALIDCILENYHQVIEKVGERIEEMEEEVVDNPVSELLEEINYYRREVAYMRKSVRPVREIVGKLNKTETDFITEGSLPFYRELSGMSDQIFDSLEIYKEMLSDLYNTYNMAISTRLNETMKFLTVFATIFIPLTFLAGIYGMNFEFIPELKFKYGYFVLLGVMLAIFLGMLGYFRKKKWI